MLWKIKKKSYFTLPYLFLSTKTKADAFSMFLSVYENNTKDGKPSERNIQPARVEISVSGYRIACGASSFYWCASTETFRIVISAHVTGKDWEIWQILPEDVEISVEFVIVKEFFFFFLKILLCCGSFYSSVVKKFNSF